MPGIVLLLVRVSVFVLVLYENTFPLRRSIKVINVSGEELAFPALLTSAAPGTTGPALICMSRAETDMGAATKAVVVPISPETGVPRPATGKLVLPGGATVTLAEPEKK